MNETFALFYVRNNQLYPIALTEEQNTMLQMTSRALVENKVVIIDEPLGKVVNLAKKRPTRTAIPVSRLKKYYIKIIPQNGVLRNGHYRRELNYRYR